MTTHMWMTSILAPTALLCNTYDNETVWLHSSTYQDSFATVNGIFGTAFVEELHLTDGRLLLGNYEARDEELGIILATNTVAFWTDEVAALWTDVGSKGFDWAAELLTTLQPQVSDGVAHATAAEADRVRLELDEILVTIFPDEFREPPPYKIFGLNPANGRASPSRAGHPTDAGELYVRSHGAGQPRQALLRSASALVVASEDDFGPEGLRAFMEGFSRIERLPS